MEKECMMCDFNDPDFGCTCPLTPDPTPEDFMSEEVPPWLR